MLTSWKRKQSSSRVRQSIILLFIVFAFTLQFAVNKGFAQQADFTVNVTTGCLPLTVSFHDASTIGGASSWTWNFGDGSTSDLQDPGNTYITAGTYTVSLTVSNGSQTDTETKSGLIVVHDFPIPNFSVNTTSGCAPLGVTFTDQTNVQAGAISDRLWVFGDGGTSSSINPLYVYSNPGDMSVSLKVKNVHGCERTKIISAPINVLGPTTKFSVNTNAICELPAAFQFTDESTGTGALSRSWNFGDNSTSTSVNPQHSYAQAGVYTVVETVTDATGCHSKYSSIVNAGFQGGLDFQLSANRLCPTDELTFNVHGNSPVTSFEWNFGNDTFSNESNPSVHYDTPGNYSITLTSKLQNNTCLSFATKTVEVLAQPPTSYIYAVDCDYNVTFKNTTTGSERVEWYIDGAFISSLESFEHPFVFSGSHIVTLVAYSNSGCSKALDKSIAFTAPPIASFLPDQQQDCLKPSLSGCAPFSLQFTNTSSSSSAFSSTWSFGDGGGSTESNPLHVFGKGTFIVTLTIQNTEGCTNTSSTIVTVSDITPVADFVVDKVSVCTAEEVIFTDQSQNANFWCWNFGDGTTGTGSTVNHKYIRPGMYTITLTSKNAGCANTVTKTNLIEVKDPFVDFGVIKNCNNPFAIGLQNFSMNYNSLSWNFGDGNIINTDVSSHTYADLGSYNVELTAVNTTTHCTTTVTIPVLIQEIKADFEIDNPTPCKNAPVNFIDKSTSATQWIWSLGNSVSTTDQNTSTSYQAAGIYQVNLTSYNSDGCADQASQTINVLDLEGKFDFTATSNCDDFTVNFKDRSEGTPVITSWNWDFGDGETSPERNPPPHNYHDPNKYTVKLTLTNNKGTCSFIKKDAITFDLPVPDFLVARSVACIDKPISLISTSIRAANLRWDLGNGQTSTQSSPQVSYPSIGNYDITLYATDKYGCEQSVTKPGFITVSKPTAAFDVTDKNGDCPPFTSFFKNKSVGNIISWQWDFGDGKKSALADPANTFTKPGDYDVKLLITDEIGCTDETSVENLIHVGGPSGNFTSNTTGNFCTGKTVTFTANTINTATNQWDFGDGSVVDMVDSQISHSYSKKGNFVIDLIMIDGNGCKVAADQNMKISVSDTTGIKIEELPDCFFRGDNFIMNARSDSEDALLWSWEINGLQVGTDAQLQTIVEESGKYALTLTAINESGCTSRLQYPLLVQDHLNLIPNVITPNNDGFNDTFEIDKINNGQWNFTVYNRWGIPVHKEPDYQGNWNGDNLDAGVYYFNVQNAQCEDENYKGPVSILR